MFRHRVKFNRLHYTLYFASTVKTIFNIILGKLHRNLLAFTDIVLESSPQSHDTGNLRCFCLDLRWIIYLYGIQCLKKERMNQRFNGAFYVLKLQDEEIGG